MRQNVTLVLLSAVVVLLFVVVIQNANQDPVLLSQLGGGGSASVGPIGIATGSITGSGDAAALWLYDPSDKHLLVYYLGTQNRLELRASRDVTFDMQLPDFSMKPGRAPGVKDIQNALQKRSKQ